MAVRPSVFPQDRWVLALVTRLERVPGAIVLTGALVAIAAIALIDGITGDQLSLSLFYLVAVGAAAWATRLRTAILVAAVAAVAGLLVSLLVEGGVGTAVATMNALFRMAFYTLFAYGSALLRNTVGELEARATIDPATGLLNRPAFYQRAEDERRRARRIGYPVTVALLDMDNLKTANDQYGHEAGDEMIAALAGALQGAVREVDLVGRMGGDEFLLLLSDTDVDGAVHVLDRVRRDLQQQPGAVAAGFSAGAATWHRLPDSVEDMVREADRLMYEAKHSRRGSIRSQPFPAVDQPDGDRGS